MALKNRFKCYARRLLWRLKPELYNALIPATGQIFSIGIYTGTDPLRLKGSARAANPVLTADDVTDVPAMFVADPFMISRQNQCYMFFEVFNKVLRRGQIGLATSQDGIAWRYDRIVLSLPSHLSYPFVFEHENDVYMIPENLVNGVCLYKAREFPRHWQFQKKLIPGSGFVDSTLFRHGDCYWLFTARSAEAGRLQSLHLFYSQNLHGKWREHPQSPVTCAEACCGRPAGKVLRWDGKTVRLGQECRPSYGTAVRAFQILELTPAHYREIEIIEKKVLHAGAAQWNSGGMHHVDAHCLPNGRWIACVDGWYDRPVRKSSRLFTPRQAACLPQDNSGRGA